MLSSKRELIQAITRGYRKSMEAQKSDPGHPRTCPPETPLAPWNTLLFKTSVRYHSKYVTTTSIPIRTPPRFRSTPLSPLYLLLFTLPPLRDRARMLHAVSEKIIRALAHSLISRPARETAPRRHLRALSSRALSALHVEACKHLRGVGASSARLLSSAVRWGGAYVLRSPLALRASSACGR